MSCISKPSSLYVQNSAFLCLKLRTYDNDTEILIINLLKRANYKSIIIKKKEGVASKLLYLTITFKNTFKFGFKYSHILSFPLPFSYQHRIDNMLIKKMSIQQKIFRS